MKAGYSWSVRQSGWFSLHPASAFVQMDQRARYDPPLLNNQAQFSSRYGIGLAKVRSGVATTPSFEFNPGRIRMTRIVASLTAAAVLYAFTSALAQVPEQAPAPMAPPEAPAPEVVAPATAPAPSMEAPKGEGAKKKQGKKKKEHRERGKSGEHRKDGEHKGHGKHKDREKHGKKDKHEDGDKHQNN